MSASTKASGNAFSFTTMLSLVLVGIICLAGIGILSAYEPELKSGNNGEAHALSKSSVGYLALARIVEKAGTPVKFDRGGASQKSDLDSDEPGAQTTVILTPQLANDAESISNFFHSGPTVIILPKWFVTRDQEKKGWANLRDRFSLNDVSELLPKEISEGVKFVEATAPSSVALTYNSVLNDDDEEAETAEFGTTKPIEGLRSMTGGAWTSVVAGPNGSSIVAKHKTKNVYLVTDPDILNNAAMANLPNAEFADYFLVDILEDDEPIRFDVTLHGFQRRPNLGKLLLEPPMLGATLCFVLASILIGIQAAMRFLPPLEAGRAVALGKRALADNTAGLIRMGKREYQMAVPYANMIKRLVLKAINGPTNIDPDAQSAMLDRVSELSDSQLRFSSLARDAAAASDPNALIKVAKDLHRWKQETTRER